jgi:glutathione synthase/RimK-type ligase-like ATP-grasp enzyme
MDLNVCERLSDIYRACQKYDKYYISEYIKKDKEWRVFVVSGRVAAVVEKIPVDPDEVSWGCVEQGQFRYVPWTEWPLFVTQKAVDAFLMSGLDFGAVDVISCSAGLSEPNRAYVLEINTAPELTPYYIKTMTKCFDYIVRNGKGMLPIIETGDFKGVIHPAVSNMAEIQPNV